jgi:hypothetical protein
MYLKPLDPLFFVSFLFVNKFLNDGFKWRGFCGLLVCVLRARAVRQNMMKVCFFNFHGITRVFIQDTHFFKYISVHQAR